MNVNAVLPALPSFFVALVAAIAFGVYATRYPMQDNYRPGI